MKWLINILVVGIVTGFKCRPRFTTTFLPSTSSTHLPKCSHKPTGTSSVVGNPSPTSYVITSSASSSISSSSYVSTSSAYTSSNSASVTSNSASVPYAPSSSASISYVHSSSAPAPSSSAYASFSSASYPSASSSSASAPSSSVSYPSAPSSSASFPSGPSSSFSYPSAPSSSASYPSAPSTSASYGYSTSIPSTSSSSIPVVPSSPPGSCKTNLYGLTFSPYDATGLCLSGEAVYQQLLQVAKLTTNIRTYGTDCNQLPNILDALVKIKAKSGIHVNVMLGLWTRGDDKRAGKERSDLAEALKDSRYNEFITHITSGNEERFNGISSDIIINNINQVKSLLREKNLNIPVATSETYKLFDKSLIDASDFVPVSIYPFYTKAYGNGTIRSAVEGAIQELLNLKQSIPSHKQLIVSETGWPTSGSAAHSFSTPSLQNQREYLALFQRMANQHNIPTYFLEAFNASWKLGETAEKFFGLLNSKGELNGGELSNFC